MSVLEKSSRKGSPRKPRVSADTVLAALANLDAPSTFADVAKAAKCARNTAIDKLLDLVQSGLVSRSKSDQKPVTGRKPWVFDVTRDGLDRLAATRGEGAEDGSGVALSIAVEIPTGDAPDPGIVTEVRRKPKGPRFQWPPPGDEDRQFHTEVAAGAVILRELGADIAIGPPATKTAEGKAIRPKFASIDDWLKSKVSGMDGLIAGGARSWNHPQLTMAARGLALGDWGDAGKLMAMQAGRIPGEGAAHWLDGEEPRSTDYDPYRWAAELVFLLRGPRPMQFRADCQEVLRRQIALATLGAVPWTDKSGDLANARGELWTRGPTLSPVGERSPKTSNPDMLGLFERFLEGEGGNDREGFAGAVADIVGFPTLGSLTVERAVEILADVPVFGSFLFREYPEGRLVMRPEQLNPNTPTCLWSWADHATQRQTRGWPFPPGKQRGDNAARSMGCAIEGNVVISRARTPEGQVLEAVYPLPKSAPIWSVRVDEQGARFE